MKYMPTRERTLKAITITTSFKRKGKMGQGTPEFEKFLADRKIGEIIIDKPMSY